jgi:hypothetical protein
MLGAIIGGALISGGLSYLGADKAAKASGKAADASIAEQRRQFDLVRADTSGQRAIGNAALQRIAQLYGYSPQIGQTPQTFEEWSAGQEVPMTRRPLGGLGVSVPAVDESALRAGYDRYVSEFSQSQAGSAGAPDMGVFFESPDYQFNLEQGQQAIDRSAAARGGLLSGRAVKEGQRYASGLASREYGSFVDRLMQQAGLGSTGIGASAAAGANAANQISGINMNNAATRGSAYMNMAGGINNAVQGGISNYLLMKYLQPGA